MKIIGGSDTPREFHPPTPAELEKRPALPPGTTEPAAQRVRWRDGGALWAFWWGRGTAREPFLLVVAHEPPEGEPVRWPTVEEMHAAASEVPLRGVIFQPPAFISGERLIDEAAAKGRRDRGLPLTQTGAKPGTPAALRLQISHDPKAKLQ